MSNVERLPRQDVSILTPTDMLNNAVMAGADIVVLEKLMALQERYEASQARKAFDAAMADAKAHMGTVHKTTKGNYGNYADFASVARHVDATLSEQGLSYRFNIDQTEKAMKVTCIMRHRDGHFEETTLMSPIDTSGSKNAVQQIGSTQTYLMRYTLMAALGLAASKDDDGHSSSVKFAHSIEGQSPATLIAEGHRIAADEGIVALGKWWTQTLTAQQRKDVGTAALVEMKAIAQGDVQ